MLSSFAQGGRATWPGWETIIGIEVHSQIKSRQKLFSTSLNSVDEAPNSRVSLFDAAFPGTLPKLNRKCVDLAIRTALGLNASVQHRSAFDRKHYFYHDLPSGYQITQSYAPIALGGILHLDKVDRTVRIKQVQLEQDTGKTTFSESLNRTQVDLNRAGAGLMEIVSEPDMRTPEEAVAYIRTLQALLRSVGASDGNMEQGSLRCDVNVSVNKAGEPWGTRCEIKNLNSTKSVQAAIACEVDRQIKLLQSGSVVSQETRGFDEHRMTTFKLRSKEDAPEYRYMPDPNLPPLILTEADIDSVRQSMPELPHKTAARLESVYGLVPRDIQVLMSVGSGSNVGYDGEVGPGNAVEYFEAVAKGRDPKVVVNWITQELVAQLGRRNENFDQTPVSAQQLGDLIDLVQDGTITGTSAKTVIRHMFNTQTSSSTLISELVDTLGLRSQAVTDDTLQKLCEQAVQELPIEADLVRKGNDKVLMKMVGKVMKLSKGTADAKIARAALQDMLSS
ncbi:hypothetical protein FRB96_000032 [Tulasnella sp. 330]|nr:hypothetical protein FRB96_000032 [Tulasnella sp. 330]KAG8890500.1 hypothetical protein FRB98_007847 [Tulasnella sp. 332]